MDIDQISGAELDYLVAIAEGMDRTYDLTVLEAGCFAHKKSHPRHSQIMLPFSSAWNAGGPLMERHDIGPWKQPDAYGNEYCMAMAPVCDTESQHMICASGKTYLEAVMRCLVKLKMTPAQIDEALNSVRTK